MDLMAERNCHTMSGSQKVLMETCSMSDRLCERRTKSSSKFQTRRSSPKASHRIAGNEIDLTNIN